MQALDLNNTWEFVFLPLWKKAIGCRWVFAIKVDLNGEVDRLKAWFVAKRYTQIYGLDYSDTFSLLAKITSVRLFFAKAAWLSQRLVRWRLHPLIYCELALSLVDMGLPTKHICELKKKWLQWDQLESVTSCKASSISAKSAVSGAYESPAKVDFWNDDYCWLETLYFSCWGYKKSEWQIL